MEGGSPGLTDLSLRPSPTAGAPHSQVADQSYGKWRALLATQPGRPQSYAVAWEPSDSHPGPVLAAPPHRRILELEVLGDKGLHLGRDQRSDPGPEGTGRESQPVSRGDRGEDGGGGSPLPNSPPSGGSAVSPHKSGGGTKQGTWSPQTCPHPPGPLGRAAPKGWGTFRHSVQMEKLRPRVTNSLRAREKGSLRPPRRTLERGSGLGPRKPLDFARLRWEPRGRACHLAPNPLHTPPPPEAQRPRPT